MTMAHASPDLCGDESGFELWRHMISSMKSIMMSPDLSGDAQFPFFLHSLRPAACAGVFEVFAVAGRGEALSGSELAGEVGGVGKAAFGGDVAHRKVGLDEELAGLADPQLRDVLADRHARAALEDALELAVRQVGDGRERGEAQGAVVVGVEEGEDALHPLPVARVFAEGDFAGGERAAAAAGKVDEDRL